jgi:hypothetical protein
MNIFVLMPGQGRIAELQVQSSIHHQLHHIYMSEWRRDHHADAVYGMQERQMTTVLDKNVYSIAVDGTSDDADVAVKGFVSYSPFAHSLH